MSLRSPLPGLSLIALLDRKGGILRAPGMAVSVLLGQELAMEPRGCLEVSRCWPHILMVAAL